MRTRPTVKVNVIIIKFVFKCSPIIIECSATICTYSNRRPGLGRGARFENVQMVALHSYVRRAAGQAAGYDAEG